DGDDDASHWGSEQDENAHLQQHARERRRTVRKRRDEAGSETEGAGGHSNSQHDADDSFEPFRGWRRRRHRLPLANISTATMKRTAAIRTFSHFAEARAPTRMPLHDPSCTPSTAAAASA